MESRENNGPYNIYAETEFSIEFYDVDPMGVAWHGHYIKYFELGRRSLLEKIGYYYHEMKNAECVFPVIEVSVKYLNPLKFIDRARIKTILMEYENRLKIKYEIRNAETGVLTTKGMSTQMAFDLKTGESCFICPADLTGKVEALIEIMKNEKL